MSDEPRETSWYRDLEDGTGAANLLYPAMRSVLAAALVDRAIELAGAERLSRERGSAAARAARELADTTERENAGARRNVEGQIRKAKRNRILAVFVALGLLVVMVVVIFVASRPVGDAGSVPVGDSRAEQGAQAPTPGSSPVQPSHSFIGAVGGTSIYKYGPYSASVSAPVVNGSQLQLSFDASGASDLRDPSSSCIFITSGSNVSTVLPAAVDLTAKVPGHYAGTMTFNLTGAGAVTFEYSCESGYTVVSLGTYQ